MIDVLASLDRVDGDHGEDERRLSGKVPAASRRWNCRRRSRKPRSAGDRVGIKAQRRAGQAPEPYGDTAVRLSKSTILSTSRSNGCACASSGVASRMGWADCRWVLAGMMAVGWGAGLSGERANDVEHTGGDPSHGVTQPHPEQSGYLVVARASARNATHLSPIPPVDQSALQRRVHVSSWTPGRSCRRRRPRRGCPGRPTARHAALR